MTSAFPVLLLTSIKGYTRNRSAMFFSLMVPLMIMVIFGLLNLGGTTSETIGVVDEAHNATSARLVDGLKQVSVLKLRFGNLDSQTAALKKGEVSLVVELPADLRTADDPGGTAAGSSPTGIKKGAPPPPSNTVPVFGNDAKPQETAIARAIVQQYFDQASIRASSGGAGALFAPDYHPIQGRSLTYVDFLVPGIIALSIMQTGIFSVGFALVAMKRTGILRRLMATPMRITDFMMAQVGTRMIMATAQVGVLLGVAFAFFHFHMVGNILSLMLVAIAGAGIFIAFGFAIAGYAKSEDAVPALANIVVLPMMFLSGVFFPRTSMPDWLHRVSDLLPLTYLSEGIRSIANDGASLWTIRTDLIGITVWLAIAVFLATRLFRWEAV